MKIYGKRSDGSLLISLGGGMGVMLRGVHASKATDLDVLHKQMGPWMEADNGLSARLAAQKALQKSRTVPLSSFHLGAMTSDLPGSLPNLNQTLELNLPVELSEAEYVELSKKKYLADKQRGEACSDGEKASLERYEAKHGIVRK